MKTTAGLCSKSQPKSIVEFFRQSPLVGLSLSSTATRTQDATFSYERVPARHELISDLIGVKPDSRVMEWMDKTAEELLYLSVLTLGEIRKGIAGLTQGERGANLETWLEVGLPGALRGQNHPHRCCHRRPLGAARGGSEADGEAARGRQRPTRSHRATSQLDRCVAQQCVQCAVWPAEDQARHS